jgi:hypothetical protein
MLGADGGQAYCWGTKIDGSYGSQASPLQVGTASDWQSLDAGDRHACGVRAGAMYCWGLNVQGQTGAALPWTPVLVAL